MEHTTMSDLPTPSAQRLHKPSWRDSRLLIGLLLVLASTAIGAYVVSRADDRMPMYAAKSGLVAGQPLTADDVVRVDVQLGESAGDYVSAGTDVPPDHFVLREVRAGELIPATAVGSRDEATAQPVALQVDATSASTLQVGSVVDVYVNRPLPSAKGSIGSTGFSGPVLTLAGVTVVAVPQDGGVMGGSGDTRALQIMVPKDKVKQVVGDVDLGAKITLVAVPGATTLNAS
ncbi:hypothetical protein N802_18355 [Knoellia sinensis KCTC 19936]|uniref:SAF domain-containing protein n=1 Tax=Knoellia sinensis KCTC 19936 TaxID=1385520 RepID=A0A0A0J8E2_9MICO|nr:hypothetical protein [Knoellia sinensis]KGN32327.1 hypothetical protein N802_18355 [Knoellia sinensis KCTC 19936]